jgi:hypothetical protein
MITIVIDAAIVFRLGIACFCVSFLLGGGVFVLELRDRLVRS